MLGILELMSRFEHGLHSFGLKLRISLIHDAADLFHVFSEYHHFPHRRQEIVRVGVADGGDGGSGSFDLLDEGGVEVSV